MQGEEDEEEKKVRKDEHAEGEIRDVEEEVQRKGGRRR